MKRVVFCQPTLRESGSENSLIEILAGLRRLEPSWSLVVVAGEDGPMAARVQELAAVSIVHAPKIRRAIRSLIPHLLSYGRVFRAVRRFKDDQETVVYVNSLMFPQAVLGGLFSRLPVIVHVREVAKTYSAPAYALYYLIAVLAARKVVGVCAYIFGQRVCRFLDTVVGTDRVVIYNASVPKQYEAQRRSDHHSTILAVIPFTARKGALDLVDAVVRLHQIAPKLEFLVQVVGELADSALHRRAIDMLDRANCTNLVEFHGSIAPNRLGVLYASANVLIHPSHTEAFPRVLVEAMSYGLPCVATNVGGSAEAVVDNVNGYLVEPRDVDGMAIRVRELLTNKTLWMRMSVAAQARHASLFTRDRMALEVMRVIRSASGG